MPDGFVYFDYYGWKAHLGAQRVAPTPIIGTNACPCNYCFNPTAKGWECPKCSAVMGPTIPSCINCTGKPK